jgi:alkanesulfonate monooxygenase SsuD/methylene tetrahydromethanopterin reductase-like flavin-dependent oxidoreductase (luciferase family)
VRLRLALRYDPLADGRDPSGDGAGQLSDLLDCTAAAEALGVELMWLTDRPDRAASALHLAAAVAARTTRMRLGVGPLPLPALHPVRLAEDAASLDGIAGGRLELGLCLGSDPAALVRFGARVEQRASRLEEGVSMLRGAFADEALAFRGRHWSYSALEVVPKPIQRPTPPLYIGAEADVALRRAARLGTGLLARSIVSAQRFLEFFERAQRSPADARIALELPIALSADPVGLVRNDPSLRRPRAGEALDAAGAGAVACAPDEAALALERALVPLRRAGCVDLVLPARWPGAAADAAADVPRLLVGELEPALRRRLGVDAASAETNRGGSSYTGKGTRE